MKKNFEIITELFGLQAPESGMEPGTALAGRAATADEKLLQGDYQGAAKQFERALQGSPDDPAAHLGLAVALACMDEAPQARLQYEEALRISESDPEPYIGLSDLDRQEGRGHAALDNLREALRLDPNNAYTHFKIAELLRSLGFLKLAHRAVQQAVVHAPDQSFYHFWTGDLLLEGRHFDEALDAFRAAIELSPGDDVLLARTALAFWGAGRPQEAIKSIRLASDLDPECLSHYGMLARFLREVGQLEDAAAERAKADQMDDYDRANLERELAHVGLQ